MAVLASLILSERVVKYFCAIVVRAVSSVSLSELDGLHCAEPDDLLLDSSCIFSSSGSLAGTHAACIAANMHCMMHTRLRRVDRYFMAKS